MNNSRTDRVFVDIHIIQSLPPSCVNRDDTGSPKTALYGGVRRARVSSQAWKRAVRAMFREHFSEDELSERTKKIVEKVAGQIRAITNTGEDEALELAEKIINNAGVSTKDQEAKALFFMSNKQAESMARLALAETIPGKRETQAALNAGMGIDIALFGRMVADDPLLNADASAQVAHAISTHGVENEYDYYTAMDDRAPEDQAGAGMIGTVEFNSSTLYRYATVAAHDLEGNLGDTTAAVRAVREFVRGFICSMPTGKINTFANSTPPYAVMVAVRRDQPINLAGAFERPVRAGDDGYQRQSARALAEYAESVYGSFFDLPEKTFVTSLGDELDKFGEKVDLPRLLENVEQVVENLLQEGVKPT